MVDRYVSKREFKEARRHLYNEGFADHEVDEVEKIFMGDMHESSNAHRGIDPNELDRGVAWMRENKSKHNLSDNRINQIEETLKDKL